MKEDNNEWTTVIKPKEKLLQVDFKELWRYRDLTSLFVRRNITTQYKQTILGPLWYIIQPAMTVIMYMVVFGGIAKIPTDGLPQPLFYLSGICLWQYFNDCLTKTSSTFIANAGIFGKVYFPRMVVPISTVISNLLRFGIQFGLFLVVYAVYQLFIIPGQIHTNWYALLLPVLVVMLAGLALGFGILFSSLTTKYRDMTLLLDFFIRLWMYLEHHHQREVAPGDEPQSLDGHRRSLQVRLPWRGAVQLGPAGLQLRLHGGAAGRRHRHLQPRATHLHGYGVKFERD